MSVSIEYLNSLLWAFAHEIEIKNREFNKSYEDLISFVNEKMDLRIEVNDCGSNYETLSLSYRNTFDNSADGQLFMQNGRYENEFSNTDNLIAYGGFGAVFKVRSKFDDQVYAIKRQNFQKAYTREENLETFNSMYKEIKMISVLKNDFLLQYRSAWFQCYEGDPELFIQMDYCPLTLERVITELYPKSSNKLSEFSLIHQYISCELFNEILEGVSYLHDDSSIGVIIHRDLKPSNILLSYGENGRFIKIADFGLATFHEFSKQIHTKNRGTNGYIAPEVMINGSYDVKADMYSLGIIVSQLFDTKSNPSHANSRGINRNKYDFVVKLSKDLIQSDPNKRPSCSSVSNKPELWRVLIDELSETTLKMQIDKNRETDINKNFIDYFLLVKSSFNSKRFSGMNKSQSYDSDRATGTASATTSRTTSSMKNSNSDGNNKIKKYSCVGKEGLSIKEAENHAAHKLILQLNQAYGLSFKFDKNKSMKQQLNEIRAQKNWMNEVKYEIVSKSGPDNSPKFIYRASMII